MVSSIGSPLSFVSAIPPLRPSRRRQRRFSTEIIDFIGRGRLLAAHPAYAQGGCSTRSVEAATLHPACLLTDSERLDRRP